MRYVDFKKTVAEQRVSQDRQIPKVRLSNKHIKQCQLLLNRIELLNMLPKDAVVAELGVYKGDFSKEIMQRTSPCKLHLIDPWETDRYNEGMMENVLTTFHDEISSEKIIIDRNTSVAAAVGFSDNYFDWIYIDTTHSYETTKMELEYYQPKIKHDGIIAGHDYITCNWRSGIKYGVIEAVHEFCVNYDWEFLYLTIEPIEKQSFAIKKII